MHQQNARHERRARANAKLKNACISRLHGIKQILPVQIFDAFTEFL
jgi:hypothetical protein